MNTIFPKAFALWSEQGDHAGFMLLSSESDMETGDCIFMLSPVSAKGVDSDLGIVVSELKVSGEHKFEVSSIDAGYKLIVFPDGFPQIVFNLNHEFSGEVFTEFDDTYKCIGTVEAANMNNDE